MSHKFDGRGTGRTNNHQFPTSSGNQDTTRAKLNTNQFWEYFMDMVSSVGSYKGYWVVLKI